MKTFVFYQMRYNFIWTFYEDDEGWGASWPSGKKIGKKQMRNPSMYDNYYLGEL